MLSYSAGLMVFFPMKVFPMYDLLHPGQVTWYTMLLLEFKGTLSLLDVKNEIFLVL